MTWTFLSDGFEIVKRVIDDAQCQVLDDRIDGMSIAVGSRNLLESPWCSRLAATLARSPALAPFLYDELVAVQCTLFTKTIDHNWGVSLHQDLSIPVAQRVASAELTGWSEKEETTFVHAPRTVLERLIAVRLHLDRCGVDDGPLECVAGSHRFGRLSADESLKRRNDQGTVTCAVDRGDVLVMRPLVLHASRRSSGTSRRRVLHFLFGPKNLPHDLQ